MSRDESRRVEMLAEINDAWLGIDSGTDKLARPLDILQNYKDDPDEYMETLYWLITQPDYLSFFIKEVLNIELLPFQALIVQEMWKHKFPMLIVSRGGGKATRLSEPIRCKNGWTTMGDVQVGDQIYGGDGKLTTVTYKTEPQFNLNFYRLTFRDGRSADVCEDHLWKVYDTKSRKWVVKSTIDMYRNYYNWRKNSKSSKGERVKEFRYAIPTAKPLLHESGKDYLIHPYIVGVLLGDGCLSSGRVTFTTADQHIVDRVSSLLPYGYKVNSIPSSKFGFSIVMDGAKIPFRDLCDKIGIQGYKSDTKFIPEDYLYGSYNDRLELLMGLMDTDGYSDNRHIEYYTVSKRLSDDFLSLARSLGIASKVVIKTTSYNGKRYKDCYRVSLYTNESVFSLPRKLKYIDHKKSKAGQSKYEKTFITNIEPIGQHTGACITVNNADSTYLIHDYIVTHNTFLLALYGLLRALLIPGRKIVAVGAAFRQSKYIHEYMEKMWNGSSVLNNMYPSSKYGSRRDIDMCRMLVGTSVVSSLPVGTGEKIRGQRANDILSDEFASMSREIFETVIAGFASVTDAPADNVRRIAAQKKAEELGIELDFGEIGTVSSIANQVVISGTCDYDFGHFADYWKRWCKIIKSGGDIKKLEQLFNGEIPKGFNWKDYCVFRIPYDLIPEGFMDESQIARAKATVNSGTFQREYGACMKYDTPIITKDGVKNIADVEIGDEVLTHKGRFRPVLKRMVRKCYDKICEIDTYGYYKNGMITPNHPMFSGDLFTKLLDQHDSLYLANLKELSGLSSIKISDFTVLLDYYSGVCFGYYASEGSIGANGKAVGFALDGHVDAGLQRFVDELSDAIYRSFGVKCRYYNKENTTNVTVNSRILSDVFKSICPGICYNKMMNHDILFSNVDFLKGFIVGIFNGDGHKREKFATITLSNINMITQVKLALSFFGISCSISLRKGGVGNINGRDVALQDAYKLDIHGSDYDKFLTSFYPKSEFRNRTGGRSKYVTNDGKCSIFSIKSKKYSDYYGLVYNLEVEEDNSYSLLNATVHNCFPTDSQGFFKRSLIEACVAKEENNINLPSGGPIVYDPMLRGNPVREYVMGVDTASEIDNFAIVIQELHSDHQRIVHCWTTRRDRHKERVKRGLTDEKDFYSYCCRKIRDLMALFNITHISIDSQGGGVAILEGLHDDDKMRDGELPIWPIIDPSKEKDSDHMAGRHIIEMVNFASADWTGEANHGLAKDFEDKVCLFPRFDPITIGLAVEEDKLLGRGDPNSDIEGLYDTLEDCVMEIEELKNELSIIEITKTSTGRDRWDTPEVQTGVKKKERLRKDRYSALIMCNMAARQRGRNIRMDIKCDELGGFAVPMDKSKDRGVVGYSGPDWFTSQINGAL